MLPNPSSPISPLRTLSAAHCRSCSSSSLRTRCRTSVAKIGVRGHPWLTPSSICSWFQIVSFHLYLTLPLSLYKSDVSWVSSGKSTLMISKSSCLDTELNMFLRSTKIAALEGSSLRCCGEVMNFSIDNCIVLIIKSIPFGIPTA